MKIGFPISPPDTWVFGRIYLEGLFNLLHETYGREVVITRVAYSQKQAATDPLAKLADELLVIPKSEKWTLQGALDRGLRRLMRRDLAADAFLQRHGIELLAFGETPLGTRIPTLTWLPDFQHVYLPEMFTEEERNFRAQWLRSIAEHGTRVMVYSQVVKRDVQKFLPQYAHKIRVTPPVTQIDSTVYATDPKSISALYNLPDKFIFLPNQFWKHKNHRAAFQAVKLLRERGIRIFLVCSGYPHDYRHPIYFAELLQALSEWNLRDQVALLGSIPRQHLLSLMRQSVCVLNPSLFEGYGMSLEEARSLGKRALVSDLPAHREQNPPHVLYFDPRDEEELANCLAQVWRDQPPGPDLAFEREARERSPQRQRQHTEAFMSVAREAVTASQPRNL